MSDPADSDAVLVARARGGDRGAFTQLYRRHAPAVGRRLRRILFVSADADDVLQTTFIEAHRNLHRYRPEASFAGWVHAIAYGCVGNYIKAKRRMWWQRSVEETTDEPAAVGSNPESQAESRELIVAVYRALQQMPAKKRIAFALHEFEGLDLAEIGRTMGVSTQTVWARVESARTELKARLGYEPEAHPVGLPVSKP